MTDNRRCNGVKLVNFYQERNVATGLKSINSEILREWAVRNNHPLEAKETKDGTILIRLDSNKPWERLEDWVGNYRQRCRSQAVSECLRVAAMVSPNEFKELLTQVADLATEMYKNARRDKNPQAKTENVTEAPKTIPPQVEVKATQPPVTVAPRHKIKGKKVTSDEEIAAALGIKLN